MTFILSVLGRARLRGVKEGPLGGGEVSELRLELGDGVAAIRGDLPCLGELVFEKRGLVGQGGDLGFLMCVSGRSASWRSVSSVRRLECGSEGTEVGV